MDNNYVILAQIKLLTQTVDELTKKISKLPHQLKEMHEVPQQSRISFCELSVNSTTKITQPNISPTDEEINYLRNQYDGQYQNKNFLHNNNFNQGWRFEASPSNIQPLHHFSQAPPISDKVIKLKVTLN